MTLKLDSITLGAPLDERVHWEFPRASGEIFELWSNKGLGTLADGFIRVADPLALQPQLERLFQAEGLSTDIPLFTTAFGDLVTFDGAGTYYGVNFQKRVISEMGVRLSYLLHDLQSGFFQREMLEPRGFEQARETFGAVSVHECYERNDTGAAVGVAKLTDYLESIPAGNFAAG